MRFLDTSGLFLSWSRGRIVRASNVSPDISSLPISLSFSPLYTPHRSSFLHARAASRYNSSSPSRVSFTSLADAPPRQGEVGSSGASADELGEGGNARGVAGSRGGVGAGGGLVTDEVLTRISGLLAPPDWLAQAIDGQRGRRVGSMKGPRGGMGEEARVMAGLFEGAAAMEEEEEALQIVASTVEYLR